MQENANKKKCFSLMEILIAMMILIIFVIPIATTSLLSKKKISEYENQKQMYNLALTQIDSNNKNIDTNGFDFENHHLNFNYLYVPESSSRLSQYDRIGFLNDDPVLNLTFDGTQKIDDIYYVRDDKSTIKGTLSATASSTTTDTTGYETDFDDLSVTDKHLNEPQPYYIGGGDACISGHCLNFYGNSTNEIASLVSFNNVIGWDQFNEVSFEFHFKLDELRNMEIIGKNNLSIGVTNSKPYFTSQFVTYNSSTITTTTNVLGSTTTTILEPIYSTQTILGTTTLETDKWYHLVATYDTLADTLNLYLDGTLETSEEHTGDPDFSLISGTFSFGGTPTNSFKGILDEAKVYDYALSNEEVSNHYNYYERNKGLLLYESFDNGINTASYEANPEVGDIGTDGLLTAALFKMYNTNVIDHSPYSFAIDFDHASGVTYPTYGILDLTDNYFNDKISGTELARIGSSDNITFEMWVKPKEITSSKKGLISRGYTTEVAGSDVYTLNHEAYIQNGYLNFSIKTDQASTTVTSLTQLEASKWYLIDFSYNGTSAAIYINGVLDQEIAISGNLIKNGSEDDTFYLGYSGNNSEYFYGQIDELRIYNRGLSGDDILNKFKKTYVYFKNVLPVFQQEIEEVINFFGNINTSCVVTNDDICAPMSNPSAGFYHNPALLYTIDMARWGEGIDLEYLDFHQIITNHTSFDTIIYNETNWSQNSNYTGSVMSYSCDVNRMRCFPSENGFTTDGEYCNVLCAASQADPGNPPYTCSGSQCILAEEGMGQYTSIEECLNSCDIGQPGSGSDTCSEFFYSGDNAVCKSDNINFTNSIGLLNETENGYFISQTFDFEKPTSILSYSLEGVFDPTFIKLQFACMDDIVDESGSLINEEIWNYVGPTDYETCSSSSYYTIDPLNFSPGMARFHPIQSCWRSIDKEPSFCKYMRFKLTLEPGVHAISQIIFRTAQQ